MLKHLTAEMQKYVRYLQQLKDYDANIAKEREERAKEEENRKLLEVRKLYVFIINPVLL